MFYHVVYDFTSYFSAFNVFRYITFRSALALIIAVSIFLFFGRKFISMIQLRTHGIARKLTPETHKKKMGTPSMGGVIIVGIFLATMLFTGNFSNMNVIVFMVVIIAFSFLGFLDDYIKESKKDGRGLSGRVKLWGQIIFSFLVALYLYKNNANHYYLLGGKPNILPNTALVFPFFRDYFIDLGIFYIPFAAFVIVSTTNAVNLTDGLDGLAIGLVIIALTTFTGITYIMGNEKIAQYLRIPFNPYVGELTVPLCALIGASIGFLWFNSHPAEVFMGDTGSLGLGAVLGVVALIVKSEILLIIIGGVFVLETLSVIIQVFSFKVFKRRVFKMSPIHHHFELSGWHESKIIIRFWILGLFLAVIALSLFKLR